MSKTASNKKDEDVLKNEAIAQLDAYMDSLDPKRKGLLAYWIGDYVKFLKKESTFDPQKLIRYKRGTIVKVHLGYRVGSEEGGLHYAVVMNVDSSQKSPTLTVIPLTSVKPGVDVEHLYPSQVYLGDEIYQALNQKLDVALEDIQNIYTALLSKIKKLSTEVIDLEAPDASARVAEQKVAIDLAEKEVDVWKKKRYHAQKMSDEISKMKRGSIALVDQITTVSKIRIYDPLYPADTLNKIRLSDDSLSKLDEKIKALFTKPI